MTPGFLARTASLRGFIQNSNINSGLHTDTGTGTETDTGTGTDVDISRTLPCGFTHRFLTFLLQDLWQLGGLLSTIPAGVQFYWIPITRCVCVCFCVRVCVCVPTMLLHSRCLEPTCFSAAASDALALTRRCCGTAAATSQTIASQSLTHKRKSPLSTLPHMLSFQAASTRLPVVGTSCLLVVASLFYQARRQAQTHTLSLSLVINCT